MKAGRKLIVVLAALCALGNGDFDVHAETERPKALVATFSGIISPSVAEYFSQAIEKANNDGFNLAIIRLDTPGGLDLSMRDIVKSILGSKIPVIFYVYPSGARAASAGVFIAMAAHVAAMSPGTNIGAAHPVMLGGGIASPGSKKEEKSGKEPMEEKVLNDASAYMKSITQQRGRNVEWAITAVTKSESISAEEAVKLKVIDFIASDINDLLAKADGMEIAKLGKLRTKNAELVYFNPTRRQKFLATIADPNVAMILMSLGAAGLFIELYNPGLILPGVVGAVSLVMAFYSFNTLSANFAGVALIRLGMLFFIAEIKVASYGLLTIGGILSILMGAVMLFNTPSSMGISVSHTIIGSTLGGMVILTLLLGWIVARAQMRKVVTGAESLKGQKGIAKTRLNPEGTVLVEGELWDAKSDGTDIPAGNAIEVESQDGMKLRVRKAGN